MKPPSSPKAAIAWVKEAVRNSRYVVSVHFVEQSRARKVPIDSAKGALLRARRIEPYPAMPEHAGTCWRVFGKSLDGQDLAVGVELFLDDDDEWAVLCTVIDVSVKRGRAK